MKKILISMLVILSFAGSAFAAASALNSGEPTALPGTEVRGGADSTTAPLAPSPLIKFSTGVFGQVNFTADTATKTSTGYLVGTRHVNGSKNFATANDITNIYWKQAAKVATGALARAAMIAEIGTDPTSVVTFAAGQGWTSY